MTSPDGILRAFQDLDKSQQDFLRTYVPELSALLDKHVNDNRVPPVCAVAGHPEPGPEADGRIHLNGTPACADHGGIYPLDLVDPRTWSRTS